MHTIGLCHTVTSQKLVSCLPESQLSFEKKSKSIADMLAKKTLKNVNIGLVYTGKLSGKTILVYVYWYYSLYRHFYYRIKVTFPSLPSVILEVV